MNNTMWISLQANINCGGKVTDVARRASMKSSSLPETKLKNEVTDKDENPFIQPKFRHFYIRNRFQELGIGDPSRNVVEMIFQRSSAKPTKRSRKVKRVLKVNNSLDILEKFEMYRETVKKTSCKQQHKRHPRSMVDGNELLQFYGTTMNCCGRSMLQVSQLCRDPTCRVCRIIQSGFKTSYNKKYGILLSKNSDQMSEDTTAITKGKNARKAVIICRTIAGGVVDTEGGACEQEYESVGNGLHTKPQSQILRNPTAVLPCFVVVF